MVVGWNATSAHADSKSFGVGLGLGVLMGKALNGLGVPKQGQGQPRQRSREGGGGGGGGGDDKAASQRQQQQSTEISTNYAAELEAALRISQNAQPERNRNVDIAISDFIKALELQHQILRGQMVNVRVSSGDNINQVTGGEVRAEVEGLCRSPPYRFRPVRRRAVDARSPDSANSARG